MEKAKYIGKYIDTSFGQYIVYLEYEYRGERYTVYENLRKGNEPLQWQHANEQSRIDTLIEMENKKPTGKPVDLDEIWKMLEWD